MKCTSELSQCTECTVIQYTKGTLISHGFSCEYIKVFPVPFTVSSHFFQLKKILERKHASIPADRTCVFYSSSVGHYTQI